MALRDYQPHQGHLFWSPPHDVLPKDHLCFIVDELVEQLDVTVLPDRSKTPGSPAYDPRLLNPPTISRSSYHKRFQKR